MTWRVDCGAYRVFVIEDGYYWRDPSGYYDKATERDWRFHPRNETGLVRMNFGCYLITDGDRVIMVDAGIGDHPMGPPGMIAGLMPDAVDALGFERVSIETVVYTHMHYDHIGGSQRNGEVVFPEARHVFHRRELAHWESLDTDLARAAQTIVGPLLEQRRVDLIDGGFEVLPGVHVFETPGHTPGHLSVRVDCAGDQTVIGGDMTSHPFHVEHPDWSLPVDTDPVQAAATRDGVFEALRESGGTLMAGHYPMPGVGRIVVEEGTRVFQPGSPTEIGKSSLDLKGSWVLLQMDTGEGLDEPGVTGRGFTLESDGQRVSGSAGLNRFMGGIGENGRLGPLATTLMAGPQELMDLEREYLQLLAGVDSSEMLGDTLSLSSAGTVVLIYTRVGN